MELPIDRTQTLAAAGDLPRALAPALIVHDRIVRLGSRGWDSFPVTSIKAAARLGLARHKRCLALRLLLEGVVLSLGNNSIRQPVLKVRGNVGEVAR